MKARDGGKPGIDSATYEEIMRGRIILIVLMALVAMTVFGRFLEVYDMKSLVAKSTLVFIGQVKSVKPSGITSSLSYPTWNGTTFEWLRVQVEVLEPIKGTGKGDLVQTVMLSVDERKGPPPMMNAPGMLEPKKGNAYLFCLAPTTVTNVYAAFTAPYDDDQAIFLLDRNHWKYRSYRKSKEHPDSPFEERHAVIWSLVNDTGQILQDGAERMRKIYATEIATAPSNRVVHLQWQSYTNPAGWTWDVPKGFGKETNLNGR